MLTLTKIVNTTCELKFQHFKNFTYVSITSRDCVQNNKDKKHYSKKKMYGYCITKKLYKENKNTPFFFLDKISIEDQFEAISSKFLKAYQNGIGWKVDFSERSINLLQALKDEKFERIVKNRHCNDGTLLNHEDKIIYHCIRVDAINGQIRDGNYHIDELVKHLKKRKDVRNIVVSEIPYYNAEYSGERAVEFTYISPKNFVSWYYPDSCAGQHKVHERLGITKFRK